MQAEKPAVTFRMSCRLNNEYRTTSDQTCAFSDLHKIPVLYWIELMEHSHIQQAFNFTPLRNDDKFTNKQCLRELNENSLVSIAQTEN
jgi:hypothetical protein